MTTVTYPLQQRGMSLIELMISVTIGLIITLAISGLFLNTNRSQKENNDITIMQENARFALETLASDLRHAGFFGNVQDPANILPNGVTMTGTDCHLTAAMAETPSGETLPTTYMLDFRTTQQLILYRTGKSSSEVTTLIAPCTLPTSVTLPAANNTLLAIKRVSSTSRLYSAFTAEAGRIYVLSNGSAANLGTNGNVPTMAPNAQVWEYMPRYYYVTRTHTLYRSTFNQETAGVWLDEPLAEGIERFHIEFGVDTDSDGAPNFFSDAPASNDFNGVVSARVHVLARTSRVDPNYTDDNTYNLGPLSVTPSTDTTYYTDPDKTRYHRQVYSTTVTIPNLRRRQTIN